MKKILYKHTKKGLYTDIYKNQVYNSKKRGHNPPEYTKIKLIEWINNQKHFELLFKNWKDSNFSSDLKPSVDRLNDYKGYTFNNIQLLTWKENNQKAYSDKINSINKKQLKAVIKYDMNHNKLKCYESIVKASKDTGVKATHISRVCRKIRKSAGNFVWKFKN